MAEQTPSRAAEIEPSDYPGGGTHRGHAAVMANISRGRITWAQASDATC